MMNFQNIGRPFRCYLPCQGYKRVGCLIQGHSDLESAFSNGIPPLKRSMDIVGALFGLILLSPLFLGIGVIIKWVSPGPVFFTQKRVGYAGRLFNCLKFRTMHVNADTAIHKEYLSKLLDSCETDGDASCAPMKKLSEDPRIIKYGKVLRASGSDELPQLINVLFGHMSLVGPRPPIPYEVEQYRQWYKNRFDVLPGLTGLWQVSGKNNLSFNEMIRLDIQYARRQSFLLDCKIILMTPCVIFSQLRETQRKPTMILRNRYADRR